MSAKRRVGGQFSEGPTYSGRRDGSLSSPQRILASETLSTVITLNYRLGRIGNTSKQKQDMITDKEPRHFTFPAPVHDTLTGFDWIFRYIKPRRLCVYGTNVGGSLALMLGLTEPRSVHAIVAEEPVCDWTGLDGYCLPAPGAGDSGTTTESSSEEQVTKKKVGRRKATKESTTAYPDLVPLLEARRQFFHKPENYFDSFASPTLFVRSAGKDCPSDFPTYLSGPDYPVPVLEKSLPEELDMDGEFEIPTKPTRRRKALARWPPHGLDYQVSGERRIVSGAGASRTVDIALPWVRLFIYSNHDQFNAGEISELAGAVENLDLDASPSEGLNSKPAPRVKPGRTRGRRKSEASLGERSVLATQGVEMVSLLHAACFFGREVSFGEERVKLVRVPTPSDRGSPLEIDMDEGTGAPSSVTSENSATPEDLVARQGGKWFREVLHKEEKY